MPPKFPGTARVPCRLGGVKIPSLRSPRIQLRHVSRSSGVGPQASSAEIFCGASGGGAAGKGCGEFASATGIGDESAEQAYLALRRWMQIRGYRLAGPKREIYLQNMLEIQFPLNS
jgi:hypothetical protein